MSILLALVISIVSVYWGLHFAGAEKLIESGSISLSTLTVDERYSLAFVVIATIVFIFLAGWLVLKFVHNRAVRKDISKIDLNFTPTSFEAIYKQFTQASLLPNQEVPTATHLEGFDFVRRNEHLLPSKMTVHSLLSVGQALLISLGLFGTFFGLSMGLLEAIPCFDTSSVGYTGCYKSSTPVDQQGIEAMTYGMNKLLGGARTAFSKSLTGLGLGTAYLILWKDFVKAQLYTKKILGKKLNDFLPYVPENKGILQQLMLNNKRAATYYKREEVVAKAWVERLDLLIEKQLDSATFAQAGNSLVSGAKELQEVASSLGKLSTGLQSSLKNLENFRADTIAHEVSKGVGVAVQQHLEPVLNGMKDELQVIKEIKLQTDKEITARLEFLVQKLQSEALEPMAQQLEATNIQTNRVASVVSELSTGVEKTLEATNNAATNMNTLTQTLTKFNEQTMKELQAFAEGLGTTLNDFSQESSLQFKNMGESIEKSVQTAISGMEAQRIAFHDSATQAEAAFKTMTTEVTNVVHVAKNGMIEQKDAFVEAAESAKQTFEAQHVLITKAGQETSNQIREAGTEAKESLILVKDTFAETLQSQTTSLENILDSLETAFSKDLEQRQEFTKEIELSIQRIETLVKLTALDDVTARQNALEVTREQTNSLTKLEDSLSKQHKSMQEFVDHMTNQFDKLQDTHLDIYKESTQFLADGVTDLQSSLNQLGTLLQLIADITNRLQLRTSR